MQKPSNLEQVLKPLWQNLSQPNSECLKAALLEFLTTLQGRLPDTEHASYKPLAFATAFTKYLVDAYSNAIIYDAVLLRSTRILQSEPDHLAGFARLCGMIADEIRRDLNASQALLSSDADMLNLTAKERADIAQLYEADIIFGSSPDVQTARPASLPDYSPSNITDLVLALVTVVTP